MELKDLTRESSLEELDLQKYWLVFKRRWLPAFGVMSATMALAAAAAVMRTSTYEAEGRVMLRDNRTSIFTGVGEETGQLRTLSTQNTPLDTQAEVIRSAPVMQETIQELKLVDDDGKPWKTRDLIEALTVKPIPGTDVLQIVYQSDDPELAAKVVNKVIEVYLRKNVQSNRAEAASARAFIEQQLPKTESAVRQADRALRQFKERYRIIALENETEEAVQIMGMLEDQLAQANAQYAQANARSDQLRSRIGLDPSQAVSLTSLSQATGVQEVLKQFQEAQQLLAVAQTRYREGHPEIASLQRRVASLNELLARRVSQTLGRNQAVRLGDLQMGEVKQELVAEWVRAEAERSGLAQRIRSLSQTRGAYRQRADVLPRLEQEQRELERRLKVSETTYEALLTRLQEVQVAENQNVGNARVISSALVPEYPIGPRKILLLAAGGIAGIFLGAITAFGLDLVDRSVKTLKEARELFGYTLLGVIPLVKNGRPRPYSGSLDYPVPWVVARDLPRSPIAESYQMLQANLKFLSSDKAINTIVVTSSVSKEGKSSVSANLAGAIAQVGRRVLLVDADLRRPSQHHIWDLTNAVGLSNVIVGQAELKDAIKQVMPNIDVLPSGVIPPNPLALLDSQRMATLLETLATEYDMVIFDSPPLSGTADAAVLGKLADGVLLVVRPGVVKSGNANAAKEFLAQSGQKVLGMVVNGIKIGTEPDTYFYYYSGEVSESDFSVPSLPPARRS